MKQHPPSLIESLKAQYAGAAASQVEHLESAAAHDAEAHALDGSQDSRSLVSGLAQLGIGLSLLMFTLRSIDSGALLARLERLDLRFLALGALLALPQLCLCALRWSFTARRLGVPLPYRDALREYGLSFFLNLALPLGVLGDALRVLRHRQRLGSAQLPPKHSQLTAALNSALVERSAGQLVVALWALAATPLWFHALSGSSQANAGQFLSGSVALAFGIGPLAAQRVRYRMRRSAENAGSDVASLRQAAGLWIAKSLFLDYARRYAAGFGFARGGQLRVLLRDFQRGLFAPRAVLAQIAMSSCVVLTLIVQLYCALGAIGLTLPPLTAAKVFPFMLLSMAVPFSFAGFGPREAATAALYHALHMSAADGAAFAMAYGALSLSTAVPGLLVFLLGRR